MRKNKYQIWFFISFIPYAAVLLILLIVALAGYEPYYGGLSAVNGWLEYYWLDVWLDNLNDSTILPLSFIVCVSYQILYILKLNEIEKNNNESQKNKKQSKAKALFIISFVPYLLFIIYAVYSSLFGLNFNINTAAAYLCIIPIFPFCIIYQIIYLILKRAEYKRYSDNKIFFLTSFIPYVLVFMMILTIPYSSYSGMYRTNVVLYWLDEYWSDYWRYCFKYDNDFSYYGNSYLSVLHLTFIACSSYQIWYILKFRLMPQSKIEIGENHDEYSKKKRLDAAKIIFIASFIPYLWVVLCAIHSSIVGITVFRMTSGGARGSHYYSYECYGIEAFISALLLRTETLCIYPIIPLCIIYQIVYLVLKKKTKEIKGAGHMPH